MLGFMVELKIYGKTENQEETKQIETFFLKGGKTK